MTTTQKRYRRGGETQQAAFRFDAIREEVEIGNAASAPSQRVIEVSMQSKVTVIGVCVRCGGDATVASPGGSKYCASCGQCARCHRCVTTFAFDTMRGLWLCECVLHYGETVAQRSLV